MSKFEAKLIKSDLIVNWEVDDQKLPQFSYKLRVIMEGEDSDGSELKSYSKVKPHGRSATMRFDKHLPDGEFVVEILCSDILGNKVKRSYSLQR